MNDHVPLSTEFNLSNIGNLGNQRPMREIQVSDRATRMLEQIIDANDDPRLIANALDADPFEFLLFMKDFNLLDDTEALDILTNVVAAWKGRLESADGNYLTKPMIQILRGFIDLNDQINCELISKDTGEESFSTELLMQSLIGIGIPVHHAPDVVGCIDRYLKNAVPGLRRATSSDLRDAVFNAIQHVGGGKRDDHVAKSWSDRYARRFGNPDGLIRVVRPDGSESLLNYSFVTRDVIPEMVERIVGVPFYIARNGGVARSDLNEMSQSIVEAIRSLNLYSIRYELLMDVSVELATQPPHPWFATESGLTRVVEYDLERADAHVEAISNYEVDRHDPLIRHEISEAVHHLCSSVLGYYGGFLGGSHLRPLYQLRLALGQTGSDVRKSLWSHYKFDRIYGDLIPTGLHPYALATLLKRLNIQVAGQRDVKLNAAVDLAKDLHSIVTRLIKTRLLYIDSNIVRDDTFGPYLNEFASKTVKEIVCRVPGVVEAEEPTLDASGFWFRHERVHQQKNRRDVFTVISRSDRHSDRNETVNWFRQMISLRRSADSIILIVAKDSVDRQRWLDTLGEMSDSAPFCVVREKDVIDLDASTDRSSVLSGWLGSI